MYPPLVAGFLLFFSFTLIIISLLSLPSLPSLAPAGLAPPRLRPVHGTLMEVTWDPPSQPHGPPPLYQVERTDLSLSDPRDLVVRGAMFPGNGYHRFPSDTLPVNSDFTGLRLSFRTRASDGLLLCAVSPGNQEEYLALQIRNGRPYFLFDPQVINSCSTHR
ncbi:unnamed protein product [Oncorhynchus mykiss]|uniref:Fibronectin type-III domain-containing protein n=1 Tax=Oncorhynchus mykiss TaxID=8022 RepID=A0A060YX18_ONCMY|nr:unnamed protein product [Oncorhynchus mykiss]